MLYSVDPSAKISSYSAPKSNKVQPTHPVHRNKPDEQPLVHGDDLVRLMASIAEFELAKLIPSKALNELYGWQSSGMLAFVLPPLTDDELQQIAAKAGISTDPMHLVFIRKLLNESGLADSALHTLFIVRADQSEPGNDIVTTLSFPEVEGALSVNPITGEVLLKTNETLTERHRETSPGFFERYKHLLKFTSDR
jgi:hypothetical protein